MEIKAITGWTNNAALIADCARLGYLRKDWLTLDPTYGQGTFWLDWKPDLLVASDLNLDKSPIGVNIDFTRMPWGDRCFDSVVFDPPYKLNGTPSLEMDKTYGCDKPTHWRDRMDLIRAGLNECARVLNNGYLLLKCQDQVCSGKVRWQTYEFTKQAETLGLGLVDRFDLLSYRRQPFGRTQKHARRNSSTLMVYKRGW